MNNIVTPEVRKATIILNKKAQAVTHCEQFVEATQMMEASLVPEVIRMSERYRQYHLKEMKKHLKGLE